MLTKTSIVFVVTLFSGQAFAWCNTDCEGLCRATAGKGMSYSVESCVQKYECQKYAGQRCEPAQMQARARRINGGGSGGGFQACMDRGTRAGWGVAETSGYCSRQGYTR